MNSNEYWVMNTLVQEGKQKYAVVFFDSENSYREGQELPEENLVRGEIPRPRRGKIDKIINADSGIVIHKEVKEFLHKENIDNIQYFNLEFEDEKGNIHSDYFIANIKNTTDITNINLSEIVWDGEQFEHVFKWVLDFDKIKKSKQKIFRPKGDYLLIVVSNKIKIGLESMGITSIQFINTKEWTLDAWEDHRYLLDQQ